MKTIITIGRSSDNDIVVDEKYETVSSHHATITRDGDSYTFEDHSTNGSYINGEFVNNRVISISYGDEINLASVFLFDWDWIDELLIDDLQGEQFQAAPEVEAENVVEEEETPKCIGKRNWGAFGCAGLWCLFNGLRWWWLIALGVSTGISLMTFFLFEASGWATLLTFTIASIVVIKIIGYGAITDGNKWAWKRMKGKLAANEFDKKQHLWDIAGKVTGIPILLLVILLFMFAGNVKNTQQKREIQRIEQQKQKNSSIREANRQKVGLNQSSNSDNNNNSGN